MWSIANPAEQETGFPAKVLKYSTPSDFCYYERMDDSKKQLKNTHCSVSSLCEERDGCQQEKTLTLNAEAILLVVTTAAKGIPFPNGLPTVTISGVSSVSLFSSANEY
mmetsp:Transcript_29284/g.62212  ORF Transcript_29284/g.62212 Transcript_29284/m.62212 type:complete len:108 (-) Transcript_29284:1073-1396(-)